MKTIKFVVFAFYVFIFSSCFLKIESHILNYSILDITKLNEIYSNNYHGIEGTNILLKALDGSHHTPHLYNNVYLLFL